MPAVSRYLLVNGIIAPFRAPKSEKLYRQLWTSNGAPLVYYAQRIKDELQTVFADKADVYMGMSFGQPLLGSVLKTIREKNYTRLIVLPLFPQYASSSSGVAIAEVLNTLKKWTVIPELKIINQFYNNEWFIKAFANRISKYNLGDYEHIIFSFHGLPVKHLEQMCKSKNIDNCECQLHSQAGNSLCYKDACYETARLLANELGLVNSRYSVSFQSRLSKNWIQPFTDKLIVAQARKGVKNILVVAPSFIADCLETTIEIGYEYRKLFQEHGGKKLQLVESLNDSPNWILALEKIIGIF